MIRNLAIAVVIGLLFGSILQSCTPKPIEEPPTIQFFTPELGQSFLVSAGESSTPEVVEIHVRASDDSGISEISVEIIDDSGNQKFTDVLEAPNYPRNLTYEGVFSTSEPGIYTIKVTAYDDKDYSETVERSFVYL